MKMIIHPSRASGTAAAPPSKSMAHRLLICAGLSEGESVIRGLAESEDILATLDCLRALGADIDFTGGNAFVRGADIKNAPSARLCCRESGSTLRFLLPLALISGREMLFTGSGRLPDRPLSVYEKICADQRLLFTRGEGGITVRGPLRPGRFEVDASVSSQFISGLCFALPLLPGESRIELLPPIESRPYIDMTLAALSLAGAGAAFDGNTIEISGGAKYRPIDTAVEGDWSNAAFLEAFSLLGGRAEINGLDENSLQGDRIYRRHFELLRAGCPEIDLSDCPDLGPVEMAIAAALGGALFTGTARLAYKESDRAAAMSEELSKLGARTVIGENTVQVIPARLHAPAQPISSHGDHRVAMAMTVLLTLTGGEIDGAEAVGKSFPDFFETIGKLGIKAENGDTAL